MHAPSEDREPPPQPEMSTAELRERLRANPEKALHIGEYLKRFVLVLYVAFSRGGKPGQALFSGLLYKLDGVHYWVTAAHCIDALEEAERSPEITIQTARLVDHDTRSPGLGIAVSLDDFIRIRVPTEMVDVAAVPILGNAAALIAASNTYAPSSEQSSLGNPEAPPGPLVIAGYPDEWFKPRVTEHANHFEVAMAARHALVVAERLGQLPDPLPGPADFWARSECLYASVQLPESPPDLRMSSIRGMSGGPVFSMEWDTRAQTFRCRLYGIQSAWLPESRYVRIEPIEYVPALIRTYIKWMHAAPEDGHTPPGQEVTGS